MTRTRVQPVLGIREHSGSYYHRGIGREIVRVEPWTVPASYTENRCTDELHSGPPFRSGGPLTMRKEKITSQSGFYGFTDHRYYFSSYGEKRLSGLYMGPLPVVKTPDLHTTTENEFRYWGAVGWNRFKPLKPNMDLNQTIAELRDFPRLLQQSRDGLRDLLKRESFLRKLYRTNKSDYYLAYQFGIKPIVSDLLSLKKAYEFTDKRAKFIQKNNGRTNRKGGVLLETSDSSSTSYPIPCSGGFTNSQPPIHPLSDVVRHHTLKSERKIWFEGNFGFHIPLARGPAWERRLLIRQGLGINPTGLGVLRTLYQVTPWSWMSDWFHNLDDILSNAVSIHDDGVYSTHAYTMCEEKYTHTINQDLLIRRYQKSPLVIPLEYNEEVTFKLRRNASPFGFGTLVPSELSAWQLSILLALGLSRT